jgi:hypothetical protein
MLPRGWPANWGGASRRRWNAKKLAALKKQLSEQKNIDAVCLAANGGRVDLLSGESGRLKAAVHAMQRHQDFEYQRSDVLTGVCKKLREMLPPLPDREAKDVSEE